MVKNSPAKIPRPKNCFILFRLDMQSKISELCPGANHRDISRIIAKWWREAPDSEHAYYREMAKQEKIQHAKMYPNYKYNPLKKTVATRPYRKRAAHEFTSLDVQKNKILSQIYNEKRTNILSNTTKKSILFNVEYASPATSYSEYLSPNGSQLAYSDSLSDSAPTYSPSANSQNEYVRSPNITVKEESLECSKHRVKKSSPEIKRNHSPDEVAQRESNNASSLKQNPAPECTAAPRFNYSRNYAHGHNLSPLSNYYNPSQVTHFGYHPVFHTANPKHLLLPYNYHNYTYTHPVPQGDTPQIPVDYINLNYYNQYQYQYQYQYK